MKSNYRKLTKQTKLTKLTKNIKKTKGKKAIKSIHMKEEKLKKVNFHEKNLKKIIKFIEFNNNTNHPYNYLLKIFEKNGIDKKELPYTYNNFTLTKIYDIQDIIENVNNILKIMFKHQVPIQSTSKSFNFVNSCEKVYIARYIFTRNDGEKYIFIKVLKKYNRNSICHLFFVLL